METPLPFPIVWVWVYVKSVNTVFDTLFLCTFEFKNVNIKFNFHLNLSSLLHLLPTIPWNTVRLDELGMKSSQTNNEWQSLKGFERR